MSERVRINISLQDVSLADERNLMEELSDAVRESVEVSRDALADSVDNWQLADYIRNLEVNLIDPYNAEIIISDQKAETMLLVQEYGSPPWDMKPYLLGSPKAKTSKTTGQKYITVPFHGNYGYNALRPSGEDYAHAYEQAAANRTFRKVTENSTGWMYPAKQAHPVWDEAQDAGRAFLEETIEELLEE